MSEENVQTDNQDQTDQNDQQSAGDVDFEALYTKEVSNSQKLRSRAQTAEATIEKSEKAAEAVRLARMEEEGKIKELNEEYLGQITTLKTENAAFAEKFKVIVEAETIEREKLMEQLPEEKRGLYEDVKLPSLRQIVNDITGTKPPGADASRPGGNSGDPIPFRHDMTNDEMKAWLASQQS